MPPPPNKNEEKLKAASKFQELIKEIAKNKRVSCEVFLAGGAAIHYFSKARDINDLDMRIRFNGSKDLNRSDAIKQLSTIRDELNKHIRLELNKRLLPKELEKRFLSDPNGRLLKDLNERLLKELKRPILKKLREFGNVSKSRGATIKGVMYGFEISLTTSTSDSKTKTLLEENLKLGLARTRHLFADKVVAIGERNVNTKISTDIEDLTNVLKYKMTKKAQGGLQEAQADLFKEFLRKLEPPADTNEDNSPDPQPIPTKYYRTEIRSSFRTRLEEHINGLPEKERSEVPFYLPILMEFLEKHPGIARTTDKG